MIDNIIGSIKQADIYKPTNDYIFQCLFGVNENKHLLIGLLNAILRKEEGGGFGGSEIISDLEIVERTKLLKKRIEDKQGILDIRAKTSEGVIIKNHHLHSVAIRAMLIPYSAWYGGEHEPQPKK